MDVGLKLCVVFLLMAFAVGCPDDYQGFAAVPGVCFSYHPDKLNFERATAYCKDLGGMLIEIRDDARHGIVSQMTDQQIWMGLRRREDSNSPWMWQGSGLSLTDTNSYWRGFQSSRAEKACANTFKKDQSVWSDQRCATKRSFICEKAENPQPTSAPGVLLVSTGVSRVMVDDDINYLNLSDPSSGLHQMFSTERTVQDVEYDPVDSMVYWIGYKVIKRAHIDGSDEQVLFEIVGNRYTTVDVVVDVVGRYILWAKSRSPSTINRAHLNGSGLEPALVAPSGPKIHRLTIDSVHRRLYWGGYDGVWSSAMNGSQVETVLADPGYRIVRMGIDVTRNRLYWVGRELEGYYGVRDFLATSQTDGQGYQVLVNTTGIITDATLDEDSGVMYWVEDHTIYQLTPHDATSIRQLVYGPHLSTGLNHIHLVPGDAFPWPVDASSMQTEETTTTTGQPMPTLTPGEGVLLVSLKGRSPFIKPDRSDTDTWIYPGSIHYLNLSDPYSGLHQLFTTRQKPAYDMDYDPVDRMVYWSESTTIQRSHPDGSGQQQINDVSWIVDLALDVDGRYIYWCDGRSSTIWRAHLNGSGVEPAVEATSGQMIDTIAIDTVHRQIYWNTRSYSWDGTGAWSASMDGSQMVNIVPDPLYNFGLSVEIDVTRDSLYWVGVDYRVDRRYIIATTQTDGQGYRVLVNTTEAIDGVTVDQDSGVIYWSQKHSPWDRTIYQMAPHDPGSTRQIAYVADQTEAISGILHVSADAASAFIGL